jgi:GPH family glycoside/pentoside/hexuronide:cation symporter
MSQPDRLPFGIKAGWAVGTVITNTLIYITSTFFLLFVTDFVGIAAGFAALLLALPKLFDIFIYPAIGLASDHMPARFGRRRPFLLAGGMLGALSLVMMFTVPHTLSAGAKFVYLLVALVFGSLGNAAFNVPYLAMPAEMTTSPQDRSTLMSFRVYVSSISQFIAGACIPLLIKAFGGTSKAYSLMAVVIGAYLAIVTYICFASTKRAPATQLTVTQRGQFWKTFPTLFASRSYVGLLLCKYTFLIGSTAHTAMAAFYVKYIMGAQGGVLAEFLLIYTVGMAVSQPLWLWIANRVGKVGCFGAAAILYSGVSTAWAVMHPHSPQFLFMALSFANGMGGGGSLLMSQSIAPDVIDDDFRVRGIRREGSLMSFVGLAEKASLASGLALVGTVLSVFHYVAPAKGQPLGAVAQQGIVIAFGVVPAVFMLIGAACLLLCRSPRVPAPIIIPVADEVVL